MYIDLLANPELIHPPNIVSGCMRDQKIVRCILEQFEILFDELENELSTWRSQREHAGATDDNVMSESDLTKATEGVVIRSTLFNRTI